MAQTTSLPTQRSGALDLFRFLAVLFVFFGHYTDTFNYIYKIVPANLKYTPVTRYSPTALFVLFMVSGYVVTMTSVKRNIKDFAITRLSRIYPLFWISCIVAFILSKFIVYHSFLGNYSFKTFLVNLTMVPTVFGHPMLNPVFHTMLMELGFYILIGVIILFKLWNRITGVLTIMLSLCVANILFLDVPVYIVVLPFLAGMLFYFISVHHGEKYWKYYVLLAISFICSLIGAKALKEQLDIFYGVPGSHSTVIIMGITTAIYILFLLIALNKLKIKSSRFSQWLGEIVFSFYLFHVYFLCFYSYFRNSIQSDLLLYGILCAAIVTSWLLNVFIEKPLSTLAKQASYYLFRKRF